VDVVVRNLGNIKMKILIVEDDKTRIKWFKEELIGFKVDIVETAKLGIALCKSRKYDLIFLDHDLGGEIYVPSENENTGYQVAKEIAKSINEETPIVVHSHNPAGAKNIHGVLNQTQLIPYSTLVTIGLSDKIKETFCSK
jgi:CheY-like chemotaxis protein